MNSIMMRLWQHHTPLRNGEGRKGRVRRCLDAMFRRRGIRRCKGSFEHTGGRSLRKLCPSGRNAGTQILDIGDNKTWSQINGGSCTQVWSDGSKLASIRTVDISPLGFKPGKKAKLKEALLKAAKEVMVEDGADTLALGCGGMTVASWLQEQIGIPVIEPIIAGLKTAEVLARIHLSQSKKVFMKP